MNSKNQIRHLKQYKDMTDDEFDEIFDEKIMGIAQNEDFEKRIEAELTTFSEEYDTDDMKSNDRTTLRQLMITTLNLDDLSKKYYELSLVVSDSNISVIEKISNILSGLRRDISKMQDDLKITRRVRKSDSAESVMNYIEDIKLKAKKFIDQRMVLVTCPKCHMLLFQGWFLFPENKNKITLTCNRDVGDGTKCGETITVTSKELFDKRGLNNLDVIPEGLR
jgi:hypothetical protein